MVRRSARLAVKSGARFPNRGMLGSFSTGALAGRTPATLLKRKSLETSQRTDILESFPSGKDYTPSSAGAWNRSSFVRVFPLGKGFVGKIIPVAVLFLLSLGAWSVFTALSFQSLFAAAFTAVDGGESTVMSPFALRSCSVLEQQPLIKAEITRLQQQLSRLRPYLFIVRWASLGILQKAKLLQLLSGLIDSEHDVVSHPDLQRTLEELKNQMLDEEKGVRAVTIKDVERIVHHALSLRRADGVGMTDYALESSGASVVRSSETYHIKSVTLFGLPLWYSSNGPNTIIQSETHPGQCWPFRGSEGFAVIELSHPVQVTHVSLEHLPRGSSPTGGITSAPKDFALYGLLHEDQREGHHLGNFTFNQDGESVQTFKLPGSHEDVYHLVELRILSNWGHPEYTCVYSFRVHGRPQTN